ALNPSGPVTIAAAHSDLLGDVQIGGTLTALTVGNIGTAAGPPLRITAAGAGPTTFAAREVVNTAVNLRGTLTSLTAASVTNSSFTANAFGTITTTGIPAAGNRGDFGASLVSGAVSGTVLGAATIAGQLGGIWDLSGNVGTVT